METLNALNTVITQLPDSVKPLVQVSLKSDPFLIAPTAYFQTREGVVIEAKLSDELEIPREVLARLCML